MCLVPGILGAGCISRPTSKTMWIGEPRNKRMEYAFHDFQPLRVQAGAMLDGC